MANNTFWWQGIISFFLLWQAALSDSDSKALTSHLKQHTTNNTLAHGKVAGEEHIEGKMSHGGRLAAIAALGEKDSDGRSVYVSNGQYGGDSGSVSAHDATPPPLYQLLQQQMEEVLAATGSAFKPFPIQNNKKYKLKETEDGVAQVPPKKPLFTFHSDDSDSDDYADETEAEADLDAESENGGYGIAPLLSSRPTPPPTRRTSSPTIATGTTKTTTNKPTANGYSQQLSKNDISSAELSKNATNVLHKHKRRITFKTVATSSQFVSTPLADLMLKFSIGIAKPSNPHSEQQDCNSSESAEAQTNATEMARNHGPIIQSQVSTKHKHIKNRKPKVISF